MMLQNGSTKSAALIDMLEALWAQGSDGVQLFDENGTVLESVGTIPTAFCDISLSDNPFLLGIWDEILQLAQKNSAHALLEFRAIAFPKSGQDKFDIKIFWIKARHCFAILYQNVRSRTSLEQDIAQSSREKRLLQEQIVAQQAKILAQAQLMQVFIENVPAAVAMLDMNLHYLAASKRWRNDFLIVGPSVQGINFIQTLPVTMERWEKALREPSQRLKAGVEKWSDSQCQRHWLRWEVQFWKGEAAVFGAESTAILVFAENITQSVEQTRKLRSQTRILQTMRDQSQDFSMIASHDLRAPLRQARVFLQILEEDHGSGLEPAAKDLLQRSQNCLNNLTGMIEGLLKYFKIQLKGEKSEQIVDIEGCIFEAVANLHSEILACKAEISVNGQAKVNGDHGILTALFQNIIENSLKYCSVIPVIIRIDIKSDDENFYIISICDNGPGIAVNDHEKAFDLFERLGADRRQLGYGVGLANSRKVAQLHGGDLVIVDNPPPGLTLIVRLPKLGINGPND